MSLLSNFFNQGPAQQSPFGGMGDMLNMVQSFRQFAANPVGTLLSMNPRLNIPNNLANDPKGTVEHLISSGQMTKEQFEQLSQTANQFQNMLGKF